MAYKIGTTLETILVGRILKEELKMYNNLPDCMYDYRPSIYGEENDSIKSDTYCEKCGKEITEEQYDELGGYCEDCDNEREKEEDVK